MHTGAGVTGALTAAALSVALISSGPAGAVQTVTLHLSAESGAPAASITKSLGLSPHDVRLIEAGLAIVVLLVIVLVLRIVRRRRETVAVTPEVVTHAFPATAESWRGSG
ncbi:MAG: hypothetical protein ACRDVW_07180, partial [Acidimicrobiales bacterium]